jgi:hypothetical protein
VTDGAIKRPKIADGAVDGDKTSSEILLTSGVRAMEGNLALGGHRVTGAADPASDTDLVTKQYVDGRVAFAYVNITFNTILAVATPGATVAFLNVDRGGVGRPCPAGALALGAVYTLNTPFAAPGATAIKIAIGAGGSFKQFPNVAIDSSGQTGTHGSFGGDDYLADVGLSFFGVRIQITGPGVDLTQLTAGDLVVRCAYCIPMLA